eukprot:g4188.t1
MKFLLLLFNILLIKGRKVVFDFKELTPIVRFRGARTKIATEAQRPPKVFDCMRFDLKKKVDCIEKNAIASGSFGNVYIGRVNKDFDSRLISEDDRNTLNAWIKTPSSRFIVLKKGDLIAMKEIEEKKDSTKEAALEYSFLDILSTCPSGVVSSPRYLSSVESQTQSTSGTWPFLRTKRSWYYSDPHDWIIMPRFEGNLGGATMFLLKMDLTFLDIVRELLCALVCLRIHKISNNDIKPSNIVWKYSDEGSGAVEVALADFGSSTQFGCQTHNSLVTDEGEGGEVGNEFICELPHGTKQTTSVSIEFGRPCTTTSLGYRSELFQMKYGKWGAFACHFRGGTQGYIPPELEIHDAKHWPLMHDLFSLGVTIKELLDRVDRTDIEYDERPTTPKMVTYMKQMKFNKKFAEIWSDLLIGVIPKHSIYLGKKYLQTGIQMKKENIQSNTNPLRLDIIKSLKRWRHTWFKDCPNKSLVAEENDNVFKVGDFVSLNTDSLPRNFYSKCPKSSLSKVLKKHFPVTELAHPDLDWTSSDDPILDGSECIGCSVEIPTTTATTSTETKDIVEPLLFCDPSPKKTSLPCEKGYVLAPETHQNKRIAGKCVEIGCEERGWVIAQVHKVESKTLTVKIGLSGNDIGEDGPVLEQHYLTNVPITRLRHYPTPVQCLIPEKITTLDSIKMLESFGHNEDEFPDSFFVTTRSGINVGEKVFFKHCPNGGSSIIDHEIAKRVEALDEIENL